MTINACPKCGSKKIQVGTLGEGVIYGMTSWSFTCRDCGYQGNPVVFDSEEEYQKFCDELQKTSTQDTKNEESVSLSNKDKEVVDYLNELAEKEPELKNETKGGQTPLSVILLVFFTVVYAVMLSGLFYYEYMLTRLLLIQLYLLVQICVLLLMVVLVPVGFIVKKPWTFTVAGILYIINLPVGLIFLFFLTRPSVKTFLGITESEEQR